MGVSFLNFEFVVGVRGGTGCVGSRDKGWNIYELFGEVMVYGRNMFIGV